jgi:uncharacterized zinc-type alcohol dehydrogenase-like protein
MYPTMAYATLSATQPLGPFQIARRKVGPRDVSIDIQYCGVCHIDLHFVRNEWQNSIYPIVPGLEIIGRVDKVGDHVANFKSGDLAAIGCMVDSCQHCEACAKGLEQYCQETPTFTCNDRDRFTGQPTFDGYSDKIVVTENFVFKVPENLDPRAAAPLLCAGVTTYSPLRHWRIRKGHNVGIVGLGGLGRLGVKLAKAMGAHVTVFTTSPWKLADAPRLGADETILSTDKEAMKQHSSSLDFLSTVPVAHDINPYVMLLKRDGLLVILGAIEPLEPGLDIDLLAFSRRSVASSLIGSIEETGDDRLLHQK